MAASTDTPMAVSYGPGGGLLLHTQTHAGQLLLLAIVTEKHPKYRCLHSQE
jgi:hypothetical protein